MRSLDGHRVERMLGAGGFGITYKAREVVIKEYLPTAWAARDKDENVVRRVSEGGVGDFEEGLLNEAQTLATP